MELDRIAHAYERATILLDIDGTLVPDGGAEPTTDVAGAIFALAARDNDIYLASNGAPERAQVLARQLGVGALPRLRKPLPHAALRSIERRERTVVVGDKFLTDGLFAVAIDAEFAKADRLRAPAERLSARIAYLLDDAAWAIAPLIALARPFQWVKNLLVFAPVFFAGAFFAPARLEEAAVAFVAFSFAASGVYALNDIADQELDRQHPRKARRPIAAGLVSLGEARTLTVAFFLLALGFSFRTPPLIPILFAYVLLNIAYTRWLKHVPLADVACIAAFYVLRIVGGGAATGTALSAWIVLCAFFAALFLAFGKRRAEFHRAPRRPVLSRYSGKMLDAMLAASGVAALLSYLLYAMVGRPFSWMLLAASVFVAVALGRFMRLMHRHPARAEEPERLVLEDPWVVLCVMAWCATLFLELYPR